MNNTAKFQIGDRVQNSKTNRVGVVKRRRGEDVYLVSVQGFGESEWKEADMIKSEERKSKINHTWDKNE
jgi:hypothetical protein